jgi:hypothetical protein
MALIIKSSRKTNIGVWAIFTFLFVDWVVLLLTSGTPIQTLWPTLVLLVVSMFLFPVIGTFFIRVKIDDTTLEVPKAAVLRNTIQIRTITALHLRRHGLGLLKSIVVEYMDAEDRKKTALLPSLSTFGRARTAQMIAALAAANPSIKIDPDINAIIASHKAKV